MLSEICEVLKAAYKNKWISTRDGNASFRCASQPSVFVTPSGVRKQLLDPTKMIKMKFDDVVDQERPWLSLKLCGTYELEPTGELPLHSMLQHTISGGNRVVLHLHPTYTVAAMHAGWDLQDLANEFPEINRYTKVGPNVLPLPPISTKLAQETTRALGLQTSGSIAFDIVGLERHGIVAVADDPWSAFEHVERLEHVCQVVLASGKRPAISW